MRVCSMWHAINGHLLFDVTIANRCINCENVCDLLVASEQHEAEDLRGACLQFAVFNFVRVRSSPAFERLPVSNIMDIVKRISL